MNLRIAFVIGGVALLTASNALAEDQPGMQLHTVMDSVFGPGKWRETGGYRSAERENQLRSEGAMTVPPGVLSRHSMGRPGAPGAYDLVVPGLSPAEAAARLRASGISFRRLLPEGPHGTQGAHLHLEPLAPGLLSRAPHTAGIEWVVTATTPAEMAVTRLREAAVAGDVDAQLQLAEAYEQGRAAPRDLVAAFVWTAAAGEGVKDDGRKLVAQRLAALSAKMSAEELSRARRFMRAQEEACREESSEEGPILVLAPAAFDAQRGCRAETVGDSAKALEGGA